jgi:hypothetical protein
MIENVLSRIDGIGAYGVVSICIFVGTFCAAFLWMMSLKKPYIHSMSQLPLEDETPDAKNIGENNRHE